MRELGGCLDFIRRIFYTPSFSNFDLLAAIWNSSTLNSELRTLFE